MIGLDGLRSIRARWLDARLWQRECLRLRGENAGLRDDRRSLEGKLAALKRANKALDARVDELIHELGPSNQRAAVLTYRLHECSERNKILAIREPALRASLKYCEESRRKLLQELNALRSGEKTVKDMTASGSAADRPQEGGAP